MKIAGRYSLAMPPERAYALLQDPAVLAKCMPGCESLDRIGEDEYAMKMKMVLAERLRACSTGKVQDRGPESAAQFPAARGRHGQDRLHEGRRRAAR